MFVARKIELEELEKFYNSDKFEFPVIYGRRRIGKTTLIKEFIKEKRAIFFTAIESTEKGNLEALSTTIAESIPGTPKITFQNFEEAFRFINELSKNEKLIFIIDEYPYLAQSSGSVSSILQKIIDLEYLGNSNLTLILSGSSMSFIEKQVLGYQSPLYGHRTAQFNLKPFTFEEAGQLLPKIPKPDLLTLWGMTGGIPLYLSQLNQQMSLKENILLNFFQTNTLLYDETQNLLNQELSNPMRYQSIIQAIANGNSKLNTISLATGIEKTSLTTYINGLIELGIVAKAFPLGEENNNKKAIYQIIDGLYQFYYRFVPKYQVLINMVQQELLWNQIQDELSEYTAEIFENFCRNWVIEQNEESIFDFIILQIGNWWGNNPLIKEKKQEEIDVLGYGLNKDEIFIGECKWRNAKVKPDVLEKLMGRSQFFPQVKKQLVVFSKSGFSKTAIEFSEQNNIKLISFNEMSS